MIKDTDQKDMVCRHFTAQNYYVQPEVNVFYKGGVHENRKLITDIDVLALRPGLDLRWELVLADCKTLKDQSPANRILWLRGLMEYFSAISGMIVLRRTKAIENEHKLFAASLRINLIDEAEFHTFDKVIIYPAGSSQHYISAKSINELKFIHNKYQKLKNFCDYIYGYAWNEENLLQLTRKIIGEAQTIYQEIDPNKPEHLALTLDAAGLFAIGLAECIGMIFNQYLQPRTLNELDNALKIIIWGGKSQYELFAKLRHEILITKGLEPRPEGSLTLPFWEQFLNLVRNLLENPRLCFYIPQIMREAAIDVYSNRDFLANRSKDDLLLVKFAMLVTNYFCKAVKFPPQTNEFLERKFIKKQSDLTHKI